MDYFYIFHVHNVPLEKQLFYTEKTDNVVEN